MLLSNISFQPSFFFPSDSARNAFGALWQVFLYVLLLFLAPDATIVVLVKTGSSGAFTLLTCTPGDATLTRGYCLSHLRRFLFSFYRLPIANCLLPFFFLLLPLFSSSYFLLSTFYFLLSSLLLPPFPRQPCILFCYYMNKP